MTKIYIEQLADGALRVADSRVSLDSIIYAFRDGMPAESIAQAFPTLSLEQVYGAITFYLANRAQVETYLEHGEACFEEHRRAAQGADPDFYRRIAAARGERLAS